MERIVTYVTGMY